MLPSHAPPQVRPPPPRTHAHTHAERLFRQRYTKAPSFLSIHMGVKAEVLPPGTECHHIIVEDWAKMEASD